nr:MAG TPA: hypothetical protein [Caudoviricetes sp.]
MIIPPVFGFEYYVQNSLKNSSLSCFYKSNRLKPNDTKGFDCFLCLILPLPL